MSLQEILEKIKPFYWLIVILVILSICVALSQILTIEERHTPIKIEYSDAALTSSVIQAVPNIQNVPLTSSTTTEQVIGSKSGKKYYYPWCGALKRVKPENQIKFDSINSARAAGYTPAANCKGLQ